VGVNVGLFYCSLILNDGAMFAGGNCIRRGGEEPFSCNVCNSLFRQLAHLWTHKRIHTLESHLCVMFVIIQRAV
jgi:uncharacterized Zn-finger protein